MDKLQERLDNLREQDRLDRVRKERERFEREQPYEALQDRVKKELNPKLRRAVPQDYVQFLRGYMSNGQNPTHVYNYNLPDSFYVAKENFATLPLYGSMAIEIIVPPHVEVDMSEGLGHCNLYFLKDYTVEGGWIPVYQNTNFEN